MSKLFNKFYYLQIEKCSACADKAIYHLRSNPNVKYCYPHRQEYIDRIRAVNKDQQQEQKKATAVSMIGVA